MRDECEHGHLRRSCDMCNVIADHVREITEKNAEIAELRYSLAQAHGVAQACEARAERAEANAANWEEQANDRVSDWDEVRAERDALKLRLAAVEDMNAACNADFSRLRAESNPDALESERAMNAALTEQLERAELARQDALAELVAARADAERMEWLAANKYSISYEPTPDDELGDGIEIVLFPMFPHMQKHVQAGSDLRKAIDAARGPA